MSSICDDCIHLNICGKEGVEDSAMTYCSDRYVLEERTPGRWLRTDDMFETLVCSECDYDTGDYVQHNFCPNCGAEMRGKNKRMSEEEYEQNVGRLYTDDLADEHIEEEISIAKQRLILEICANRWQRYEYGGNEE